MDGAFSDQQVSKDIELKGLAENRALKA